MKKNLTEIVFILDRSGSMHRFVNDVIEGFNSMIKKYKEELEEAYITTVLFDDKYEVLHDHVNLNDIKPITNKEYYALGWTALYDALGKTINSVGARLFNTPEEERPEKVIFVINTDGEENSSREFTRSKVKEMIEHQQEKYSWGFLFLGANIDAETEAESIGISRNFAAKYATSSRGLSSSYDAVTDAVCCMAACDSVITSDCATSVKAILNDKVVSAGNNNIVNAAKTYTDVDALVSKISVSPLVSRGVTRAISNISADDMNLSGTISLAANQSLIDAKVCEITDADVNDLFGIGTE